MDDQFSNQPLPPLPGDFVRSRTFEFTEEFDRRLRAEWAGWTFGFVLALIAAGVTAGVVAGVSKLLDDEPARPWVPAAVGTSVFLTLAVALLLLNRLQRRSFAAQRAANPHQNWTWTFGDTELVIENEISRTRLPWSDLQGIEIRDFYWLFSFFGTGHAIDAKCVDLPLRRFLAARAAEIGVKILRRTKAGLVEQSPEEIDSIVLPLKKRWNWIYVLGGGLLLAVGLFSFLTTQTPVSIRSQFTIKAGVPKIVEVPIQAGDLLSVSLDVAKGGPVNVSMASALVFGQNEIKIVPGEIFGARQVRQFHQSATWRHPQAFVVITADEDSAVAVNVVVRGQRR